MTSKPIKYVAAKLREYNAWVKDQRRRQTAIKVLAFALFNFQHALNSLRERFEDEKRLIFPGLQGIGDIIPFGSETGKEPTKEALPPAGTSKSALASLTLHALLMGEIPRCPLSLTNVLRELEMCCERDLNRRPLGDQIAAAVSVFTDLGRGGDGTLGIKDFVGALLSLGCYTSQERAKLLFGILTVDSETTVNIFDILTKLAKQAISVPLPESACKGDSTLKGTTEGMAAASSPLHVRQSIEADAVSLAQERELQVRSQQKKLTETREAVAYWEYVHVAAEDVRSSKN